MTESSPDNAETPFSNALGRAITRRGVTLGWLHQRLRSLGTPVSLATLSYWRSGRSQPEHATSLDALRTLDDLLHLPKGHLRSQLQPSRRVGPRRSTRRYGELQWEIPHARQLLESLGYPPDARIDLEETNLHLTLDVDRNRWGSTMNCRSVWRALANGAQGHPDMIELDKPQEGPPEFHAVSGCSLGRSHYDAERGTYGYEVLLDRHLAEGATAVTEYALEFPGEGQVDTLFSQDLTWRVSELVLWVRFHPTVLPTSCEAFVLEPSGTTVVHPIS